MDLENPCRLLSEDNCCKLGSKQASDGAAEQPSAFSVPTTLLRRKLKVGAQPSQRILELRLRYVTYSEFIGSAYMKTIVSSLHFLSNKMTQLKVEYLKCGSQFTVTHNKEDKMQHILFIGWLGRFWIKIPKTARTRVLSLSILLMGSRYIFIQTQLWKLLT